MTVSHRSKLLLIVAASLAIAACGKLEYDWKGLGFASESEMEAAHKVGYHTKQKLDEMRPKPVVAQTSAPIAQSNPVPPAATAPLANGCVPSATNGCISYVNGHTASEEEARLRAQSSAAPAQVTDEKPASPSFDCAKASTDVERMICGDNKLADLDRRFSDGYKMNLEGMKPEEKARMKAEQIKWLKTERNVCKDKACISDAYQSRIRELTGD
jgi:uncharacterized protein YecT (DUF1311 family)